MKTLSKQKTINYTPNTQGPHKRRCTDHRLQSLSTTTLREIYISEHVPCPNIVVGGHYRLESFIGNGTFGDLYRAVSIKHGDEAAVKLESSNIEFPQLSREAKIYAMLNGSVGFPRLRYYGSDGPFNVLVMDLLGPSLEDCFNVCSRKFSLKTTLMLAEQIISRVEYIHMNGFLHRDIKPDNFLMGIGPQELRVFMIDFGLAKKFCSLRSRQHISYHERHDLIGTARYASLHAHYAEQSRRDDLEAVGYMLLYFLCGRLPWQGVKARTRRQKFEKIALLKSCYPLKSLCKGTPVEFYIYMKYCKELKFFEMPNYLFLRRLFKIPWCNSNLLFDFIYDWESKSDDLQKQLERKKQFIANRTSESFELEHSQDKKAGGDYKRHSDKMGFCNCYHKKMLQRCPQS